MPFPSRLLLKHDAQQALFQPIGRAMMQQGLVVRRSAEQLLAEGVREVRIDLSQCTYMDSTFLGTLLFLLRNLSQKRGRFGLQTPSPECQQLIEQMGLEDVYPQEDGTQILADADWIELFSEREDAGHMTHDVLQAHQELAKLPGKVGETFQQVARCLAREDAGKQHKH